MNILQAELTGMHAGDGTLYKTNSNSVVWELRGGLDEREYYLKFVSPLLYELFGIKIQPKHRSGGGNGSFGIQTCNKKIVFFLSRYFPIGEKSSKVRIPEPVFNGPKSLQCAFLRGLFDTDGCVRFDKNHTLKHYYPKIEVNSVSKRLIGDVGQVLQNIKISYYTWTNKNSHCLCIPGKKNLEKWCCQISSSNPKHLNKLLVERSKNSY